MPFGGGMGIKGHRNMGGIFFIDEVDERIGKTKLSVCVPPSAGKPGTADKGVIGTVDQRHGIQKKNLFTHCAKVNNRKEAEKTKSSFMNFLKKCVPGMASMPSGRYGRAEKKPPHRNAAALLLSYENPICRQI
jgi:hypothetical protein